MEKDSNNPQDLSQTALSLDKDARTRYLDKLRYTGCVDPYIIPLHKLVRLTSAVEYPAIQYHDIYHYFVNSSSAFTGLDLKAYKSLESYNLVVNDWVRCPMLSAVTEDTFVCLASVFHSMKLSEPPLKPWLAAQQDGTIITGHCDCKAGLSEACSHIAALAFAVFLYAKSKENVTPTQLPCSWLDNTPKGKPVEFAALTEINFSRPSKKFKNTICPSESKSRPEKKPVPAPTDAEKDEFYQMLNASEDRNAILSVIQPYSDSFIPKSHVLPAPLRAYYSPDNINKTPLQLLTASHELYPKIVVTQEQANNIEEYTRKQTKSKISFDHRAGRVTASIMKSAVNTDPNNPSVSVIKRICYPESQTFANAATRWGADNENKVREIYASVAKLDHPDLTVTTSGLQINPEVPTIGASPDGLLSCSCHGDGVLEIKCPYNAKDKSLQEACQNLDFCLSSQGQPHYTLKRDHQYYYQVQAQLFATKRQYADFVVWIPGEIYIERITPNTEFITDMLEKVELLYKKCILPEILGKRYTHQQPPAPDSLASTSENGNTPSVFCYCRSTDTDSPMIECQSGVCKIKKFHVTCLRFKRVPKMKWFCVECRKTMKSN